MMSACDDDARGTDPIMPTAMTRRARVIPATNAMRPSVRVPGWPVVSGASVSSDEWRAPKRGVV